MACPRSQSSSDAARSLTSSLRTYALGCGLKSVCVAFLSFFFSRKNWSSSLRDSTKCQVVGHINTKNVWTATAVGSVLSHKEGKEMGLKVLNLCAETSAACMGGGVPVPNPCLHPWTRAICFVLFSMSDSI